MQAKKSQTDRHAPKEQSNKDTKTNQSGLTQLRTHEPRDDWQDFAKNIMKTMCFYRPRPGNKLEMSN